MTTNQLLKETYALGFEDVGEADAAFSFSASRALRQIYSELAGERRSAIIASSPTVTYHAEEYIHGPDEQKSFSFTGRSLSFKHSGRGNAAIEDKTSARIIAFYGDGGVTREFFDTECKITFYGEYSFYITDLAAFNSNYGYKESSIPVYSKYTEYELGVLIPDFSIMTKPPTDKDGRVIEGAHVLGDTLYIPHGYSGEVFVTYIPCPPTVDFSAPAAEIDIPKALKHLLPILTASYLWLDDDPDKAEYYASIYKSEAARLTFFSKKSVSEKYTDVTGWA